jgi:hypothetical protein
MQDAEFFNDLAYKDNVLVSWATLGGPHGRDFTE